MNAAPRTHRLFWFVGILLLIGTAVGAGYALNNSVAPNNGSSAPRQPQVPDKTTPPGAVCIGLVDIEPGVTQLYPVQPGRVTWIIEEDKTVKKGDVLLKLDDRLARFRVTEAKADVSAARETARQAESLPEQYKQKIAQQTAAVEGAKFQKAIAEEEKKLKEKAYNDKVIPLAEKNVAVEKVNAHGALVQAEEGKLRELQLLDPKVDLERARADVAAKEARLEQAQLALLECEMVAPADGLVLRVMAHVGEVLGANPRTSAIQFAPTGAKVIRAEVLQEWASNVQAGQEVRIEDDTYAGPAWTGKVKRVSQWFAEKRSRVLEPFMFNDVRTLECLIEVTAEDQQPLRIGQRVRVTIHAAKGT